LLQDAPSLPLTLNPGGTTTMAVRYDALDAIPTQTELQVLASDGTTALATFFGPGSFEREVEDTFIAPIDAPVDILFALDRSCSMRAEHELLASAFTTFITTIRAVTEGWQIGIVSQDDGCFNLGVLTEATPDLSAAFSDAVTFGEVGALSERLLWLTDEALQETPAGACNSGFLRPDAQLHVIAVSDEAEQSGTAPEAWVSSYQGYLSHPNLLKVSGIVDLHTTCGRGTGPTGYAEAAEATDGLLLDVCDKAWGSRVDELALASLAALRRYTLSDIPYLLSLSVTIDGTPTSAYSYKADSNEVVFEVPPTGGSEVGITYGVPSSCN
jgi:hypothetical protein